MATDTGAGSGPGEFDTERFEDIDWDGLGRGGLLALPRRTVGFLGWVGLVGATLAYDYFVIPQNRPTFTRPIEWDVSQVDWLLLVTLAAVAFYGVYPLIDNPRMTRHYWREFRKNTVAVWSAVFVALVFGIGLVGPLFIAKPELNVLAQYQPPVYTTVPMTVVGSCLGEVTGAAGQRMCHGTWQYPLGTTGQGKGILTSVVYGMRVSLEVGLITPLIIIVIGTSVGTVAAYSGGLVDEVLMRYVDIQITFPTFFLYLLLLYLYGGTLFLLITIFGITSWGGTARLVRSEALQRREEEYIRAARSAGAGELWIIRKHLVPNVSNTVITNASLLVPSLILFEATFSFLGLGDPTVPSWGQVIAAGRGDLDTAWWISTIPGVFLFLTVLALNFVGDALRDALDPRAEG